MLCRFVYDIVKPKRLVLRGGQLLEGINLSVSAYNHAIGECSPDINADSVSHFATPFDSFC
jgi:hypothetical protein